MDTEVYIIEQDQGILNWKDNAIKQLVFYRQNRRGKPLKVSREKYLREDLHCGSLGCRSCPINNHSRIELESDPPNFSKKFSKHYLLPDNGFLIRQLDIIEEFSNVILLQIEMEEVFRRSSAKYKRLREGYKNRKWSLFLNEHHIDTYIDRKPGETEEQRNQRAFVKAYYYLTRHFQAIGIQLVILSDDPDFIKNNTKYQEDSHPFLVATGEEYVSSLIETFHELEDKLCKTLYNEDESIKRFVTDFNYPPHVPTKDIQEGIRVGKYFQGPYRTWNFYEGSVHLETGKEILIQGLENINRSTDGDVVAIEILSEEQWSIPSGMVVINQEEEEDSPLISQTTVLPTNGENEEKYEGEEQELLTTIEKLKKNENAGELKKATGRVIGVIRRKWLPCSGIIRRSQAESSTFHFFLPDNRKLPKVRIETRNAKKFEKQKLLVQIDNWPSHSRYPIGHILKILGLAGDKETETSAILHEHGIPHGPFTKAVEACLPTLPYDIPMKEFENRKDFRSLLVLSVDPPGCTDIDDALHSEVLSDGNYEVGVHIADVSHYVKRGTALDDEASKRATSVYLADRRIDMIPPLLSSNLCSLHANSDKLVFSVIWKLTPTGKILDTKFHKGIICSKGALTYDEAQAKLNSKGTDPITLSLRRLSLLAQELKRERFARGALMLSSAEVRDEGDSDLNSEESHSMVEEFMLLANCSVAEFVLKTFREYSVLRRHPLPPPSNFEPLLLAAKAHGITLVVDQGSKALNDSIEIQPDEVKSILRVMTTRCMTQALYCCSGTTDSSEYRHFGLAVDLYTHFTSPIRRYADLMVHRLLAMAIGVEEPDPRILVSKQIHAICENINVRHRMAQYASRASNNWHKSRVLLGKKEDVHGWIMCVRRNALQVFVPSFGMEGFVFYPKDLIFQFDEKNGQVSFGSTILHPLDKVKVRIGMEEDRDKVSLKLLEPIIPGLSEDL